MKFGEPNQDPNKIIIDIAERRKKKQNAGMETQLGQTPDGYIIYPPEKIEITVDEALKIADDVIEKYNNPQALFEDYLRREKSKSNQDTSYIERTDEELRQRMESSLDFQIKSIKKTETDGLIKMLALHKKAPAHYYGIIILAPAIELKKRLNSKETK